MANWINLLDVLYPIGSIYCSINSTSPASTIGGSWTQITNAVLRASTIVGYSGSDTHTITINEMPVHDHGWHGVNVTAGITGQSGNYPIRMYEDVKSNWYGNPVLASGGGLQCQFFQEYTTYLYGTEQLSISLIKGGIL